MMCMQQLHINAARALDKYMEYCDNRIWLRNYQVVVALDKNKVKHEGVTLIEVGPRVSLQPIKVRSQHMTEHSTAL
jgi:hypothetical protein